MAKPLPTDPSLPRIKPPSASILQTVTPFLAASGQRMKELALPKEVTLRHYVRVGSYYVAKRLLAVIVLFLFLVLFVMVYFGLVNRPAAVSRWLGLPVKLYVTAGQPLTYTGLADVYDMETERLIYSGPLADGLYEGEGKLYTDDFDPSLPYCLQGVYRGVFAKGRAAGPGAFHLKDGSLIYQGGFAEGRFSGPGTLFAPSGHRAYQGEFAAGRLISGTAYRPDGTPQYTGGFAAGRYDGEGTQFTAAGAKEYEGAFVSGRREGPGTLYDAKGGVRYKGTFRNNEYDGAGVLYDKGALRYEGTFASSRYQGEGTLYDAEGLPLYQGAFVNGAYQGQGELLCTEHNDPSALGRLGAFLFTGCQAGSPVYKGRFAGGRFDGLGSLPDADGSPWFTGYFRNGELNLPAFLGLTPGKLQEVLGEPDPADAPVPAIPAAEPAAAVGSELLTDGAGVETMEPPPPSQPLLKYSRDGMNFVLSGPGDSAASPQVTKVELYHPKVISLLQDQLDDKVTPRNKSGEEQPAEGVMTRTSDGEETRITYRIKNDKDGTFESAYTWVYSASDGRLLKVEIEGR